MHGVTFFWGFFGAILHCNSFHAEIHAYKMELHFQKFKKKINMKEIDSKNAFFSVVMGFLSLCRPNLFS